MCARVHLVVCVCVCACVCVCIHVCVCVSQAEDAVMSVSYLLEEPSLWSELEVSHTDIPGPPWYVQSCALQHHHI